MLLTCDDKLLIQSGLNTVSIVGNAPIAAFPASNYTSLFIGANQDTNPTVNNNGVQLVIGSS